MAIANYLKPIFNIEEAQKMTIESNDTLFYVKTPSNLVINNLEEIINKLTIELPDIYKLVDILTTPI